MPTLKSYLETCVEKGESDLNYSPKMWAILGYIGGVTVTSPPITDMAITSDGFVMAQREGDIGMNDFIGDETSLKRNLTMACNDLGIKGAERTAVMNAIRHC